MKTSKVITFVIGALVIVLVVLIFIPAYFSGRRRSEQLQKEQYGNKTYRQAPPPR